MKNASASCAINADDGCLNARLRSNAPVGGPSISILMERCIGLPAINWSPEVIVLPKRSSAHDQSATHTFRFKLDSVSHSLRLSPSYTRIYARPLLLPQRKQSPR